jgi:predicted alpha/beta superfamily hydrolase
MRAAALREAIPTARLAALLLLPMLARPAHGQDTARGASHPPVTIANTERRTLHARATGRDYDLYVLRPSGASRTPGARYPVVYVLDGQWDFKLLASIQGGLFYDRYVPDAIVVGITYSGAAANYDSLRAIDYTPVGSRANPGAGGGARFLDFLKTELIPFVESNYPADPARRMLLGSSLGGIFTLYAMFAEPGLFAGYAAVSPAVTFAERSAFAGEAAYARAHRELPTRLFIAVGGAEPLAGPVQEFVAQLRGRGYRGLALESRTMADERHSGVKPEAFNRGLRFLFRTP